MKNGQSVKKYNFGKFELSSKIENFIAIIWHIVYVNSQRQYLFCSS